MLVDTNLSITHFKKFAHLSKWMEGASSKRILEWAELVSFDVFDTLLFRRCSAETVQRGVAAALGKALGQSSDAIENVLRAREQAYADAALQNQKSSLDFEAHLDAINLAWVKRLTPEHPERWEALASIARNAKIRFERWACYANPVMPSLLQGLRQQGKRLVFVSDMYLGEALVSELLADCGLRQYFSAGYVSGDILLTKHSGRLFSHVLQTEGVMPENMLHIGDNSHADGWRAVEQGIRAVVVRERKRPIKRMLFDHRHALLDPRWHGHNATWFASVAAHHTTEPQIFALGRDVLGAPFAAFIHGLTEYCLQTKPDAVYFLSREGMLLKDLYDRFVETMDLALPKGGYLCASRLSAATAAMRGYGRREIMLKLNASRIHTVRGMLSLLRLPPDKLETLAHFSSDTLDLDQPLDILNSPAFARLVENPAIQARARQLGEEARRALRAYLRTRGFFNAQRVVLVDVGWAGQIQEGLQLALNEDTAPELLVYYLGANRNADERRRAGLKIHADVTDMTRYEWMGGATFDFVQLFEIPSRAPHGTVVGYRDSEPVLMTDDHAERTPELSDEPRIALLQEGIRDFMRHYSQYAALTGLTAADVMTYARNVIARVIRLPRRSELCFFSSLVNVANLGSDEMRTLADMPSLLSFRKFMNSVNTSLWRQGAVALRLGRFGALAHSVFRAPRIRVKLPGQVEMHLAEIPESMAPWKPFTPPAHGFEVDLERHATVLADQARAVCPEIHAKPALSVFELACLHIGYRLANAYLALKGLGRVPADLLPLWPWLWREVYIRFYLGGLFGRRTRQFKMRFAKIIHFGE